MESKFGSAASDEMSPEDRLTEFNSVLLYQSQHAPDPVYRALFSRTPHAMETLPKLRDTIHKLFEADENLSPADAAQRFSRSMNEIELHIVEDQVPRRVNPSYPFNRLEPEQWDEGFTHALSDEHFPRFQRNLRRSVPTNKADRLGAVMLGTHYIGLEHAARVMEVGTSRGHILLKWAHLGQPNVELGIINALKDQNDLAASQTEEDYLLSDIIKRLLHQNFVKLDYAVGIDQYDRKDPEVAAYAFASSFYPYSEGLNKKGEIREYLTWSSVRKPRNVHFYQARFDENFDDKAFAKQFPNTQEFDLAVFSFVLDQNGKRQRQAMIEKARNYARYAIALDFMRVGADGSLDIPERRGFWTPGVAVLDLQDSKAGWEQVLKAETGRFNDVVCEDDVRGLLCRRLITLAGAGKPSKNQSIWPDY